MTKNINKNQIIMTLRKESKDSLPKENFKSNLKQKLLNSLDQKQKKQNIFQIFLTNFSKQKPLFFSSSLVILLGIVLTANLVLKTNPIQIDNSSKTNNWEYKDQSSNESLLTKLGNAGSNLLNSTNSFKSASMTESSNLGYATGGAKDINNFRDNIKNGFLPIPTDITPEGLFYNYYFDTGKQEECKKLFCPSYAYGFTKDPLSNSNEYYMTIGLNSGIKESDFKRKSLNLMVVLDISGSMGSSFDKYYYDSFGNQISIDAKEISNKTKLEIAKQTIIDMTKKLNENDNFGMVLFDDQAYIGMKMSPVKSTDMDAVRNEIAKIQPQGGTNMQAGMQKGKELLDNLKIIEESRTDRESRIVFLTDAMPNTGYTSEENLDSIAKKYSDQKIYSTFLGIGVDFNTQLVESLTKVRGANYFSIHSEKEFKKVLDEDFDFMVTPMVFDLQLNFEAKGIEIEKIYGSPEANQATGELMKVNTLFPSRSIDGKVKGGVVLLKLKKTSEFSSNGKIKLTASYEDRNGKKDSDVKEGYFKSMDSNIKYLFAPQPSFDNLGIRKAILLSQYTELMKDWLIETNLNQNIIPIEDFNQNGIRISDSTKSEWERTSKKLSVNAKYKTLFTKFKIYFDSEKKAIGDDSLSQESEILSKLIGL